MLYANLKYPSEDSSTFTRNSYIVEWYFWWSGNAVGTQKRCRNVTCDLSRTLLERHSIGGTFKFSGYFGSTYKQATKTTTTTPPTTACKSTSASASTSYILGVQDKNSRKVASCSRQDGGWSTKNGSYSFPDKDVSKFNHLLPHMDRGILNFEVIALRTIWVGRKFRCAFSISDLFQIRHLDQNWWTCGPICFCRNGVRIPQLCDIITNKFWSNGVSYNLSRQKVSRCFLDLRSVSNSSFGPELMDMWSDLLVQNRVRMLPHWCDVITNKFWSNGVSNNLSRQKVSRFFLDLGSVSNSLFGSELMDLWSDLRCRNRVRMLPYWCDIIANEFWSNGGANNLSRQKVSRYFLDLGSVSNSLIGPELMDLWSDM